MNEIDIPVTHDRNRTSSAQDEYRELRAAIRERGTARVIVFVGGIAAWAAATIATAALAPVPVATMLPLVVLASVFEAVFALHIGVERIGRYLQVYHEAEWAAGAGGPVGWEHAAMVFGHPPGAASADPLFTVPFLLATLFNVVPALVVNPAPVEIVFVVGAHALFGVRVLAARRTAARQRAIDLDRFTRLRRDA